MNKTNIEVGQGILGLEFGMDRREVKKILGKPDEIETWPPDEEEEGSTEVWHYDDFELSASFDEADDWVMTSLAVSSEAYLFEGVNLIGLSLEETMQQIEFLDIGEFVLMDVKPDENDDDDDTENQVATIFHAGVNLWFENGITSEIQWGPIWEEEEQPSKKKKEKIPPKPLPKEEEIEEEEDDFYPTPNLIWGD